MAFTTEQERILGLLADFELARHAHDNTVETRDEAVSAAALADRARVATTHRPIVAAAEATMLAARNAYHSG